MMSDVSFSIRIEGSAAKELARIVKTDRTRIVASIDRLAENPFLGNVLKGHPGRQGFLRPKSEGSGSSTRST